MVRTNSSIGHTSNTFIYVWRCKLKRRTPKTNKNNFHRSCSSFAFCRNYVRCFHRTAATTATVGAIAFAIYRLLWNIFLSNRPNYEFGKLECEHQANDIVMQLWLKRRISSIYEFWWTPSKAKLYSSGVHMHIFPQPHVRKVRTVQNDEGCATCFHFDGFGNGLLEELEDTPSHRQTSTSRTMNTLNLFRVVIHTACVAK